MNNADNIKVPLGGLSQQTPKCVVTGYMHIISSTLWRPSLPHGYTYKVSYSRPGKAVNCNFWHPGALTLSPERVPGCQKLQMMTWPGLAQEGCFIAVSIRQQWASKD